MDRASWDGNALCVFCKGIWVFNLAPQFLLTFAFFFFLFFGFFFPTSLQAYPLQRFF